MGFLRQQMNYQTHNTNSEAIFETPPPGTNTLQRPDRLHKYLFANKRGDENCTKYGQQLEKLNREILKEIQSEFLAINFEINLMKCHVNFLSCN